jgi:predicted kinase
MILEMLVGLPGSGKTTYSNVKISKPNWCRIINKDEIRAMNPGMGEKRVIQEEERILRNALTDGKNCIVDNTHLNPVHLTRLQAIAKGFGADFIVNSSFLSVPIEECIRRDSLREGKAQVGEKVIRGMWEQYGRHWFPRFLNQSFIERNDGHTWGSASVRKAILCDLDGTLAFSDGRSYYDEEACESDIPNYALVSVLKEFTRGNAFDLIFMSGRQQKAMEQTKRWLNTIGFQVDGNCFLYMRETGDTRGDDIVKKGMYETFVKPNWNVTLVFDDRVKVVDMWRSLGIFVADCNQTRSVF